MNVSYLLPRGGQNGLFRGVSQFRSLIRVIKKATFFFRIYSKLKWEQTVREEHSHEILEKKLQLQTGSKKIMILILFPASLKQLVGNNSRLARLNEALKLDWRIESNSIEDTNYFPQFDLYRFFWFVFVCAVLKKNRGSFFHGMDRFVLWKRFFWEAWFYFAYFWVLSRMKYG